MRVDKAQNIAKVLKEVINDPLATQREISERTGVWLWTVNRSLEEVEQIGTKEETIVKLVAADLEIQRKIAEIKLKRLTDDKQINNSDINKWEETALKRSQLLTGWNTDKWEITFKWES